MKKTEKMALILMLILALTLLTLNFEKLNFTGNSILQEHAYTKALCDSNGYCEDYLISCKGNNLQKVTPTGFATQTNHKNNLNETLC